MGRHIGKQSAAFDKDIFIINTASTVGQKEGEGPLKEYFDVEKIVGKKQKVKW